MMNPDSRRCFPWLEQDARYPGRLAILKSKAGSQGRYTLESFWTAWKDREFGLKKTPSLKLA